MKTYDYKNDIKTCVKKAINEALNIYINRLINKYYDFGLEATFQMHFAITLEEVLKTKTFSPTERYVVMPEKNFPIDGNKDYIDIAIQHTDKYKTEIFLIELKYKKISDGAPNLGNIESYIDIYNLGRQLKNNQCDFSGAYFIFMTNNNAYLKQAPRGKTRNELPMHDNYTIEANRKYTVTNPAAKKKIFKYPQGFTFSKDYYIEYTQFNVQNTPYWYYMLEI